MNSPKDAISRALKMDFPLTQQVAYLDTAAEGLPPRQTHQALEHYLHLKMSGTPGRRLLFAQESETLNLLSRLLGTSADRIALLSCASAPSTDWDRCRNARC